MSECQLIQGDCLDVLRELPSESVQTCVTSPPYFGLRDYGVAGQIGLEASPQLFVEVLVNVFREVRRILKHDGTCWMNLGDSYASNWPCNRRSTIGAGSLENGKRENRAPRMGWNLKDKDLMMIPHRVAIALQDDGWYVRQDIVWSKPNPMPESVTDRCTKAHEYIFLLSKSAKYFYDSEAIKEPNSVTGGKWGKGVITKTAQAQGDGRHGATGFMGREMSNAEMIEKYYTYGRNKRSVWTVTTQPYSEAHFATFPEKLIEPCILAGSRPGDTVLDPFNGAGTTGLVSLKNHRRYIGIELNEEYLNITRKRLSQVQVKLF